jgi:hypothetical protein
MKQYRIGILFVLFALGLSSGAQAALHDRGGGLIYDDVLDVTWLQNPMLIAGTPFDDDYSKAPAINPNTDGLVSYYAAQAWVQSLQYYDAVRNVTWTGWRLPRVRPVNGVSLNVRSAYDGSTDVGYNITSTQHELAYMYYVNLKNKGRYNTNGVLQTEYGLEDDPADPADESLFPNLKAGLYWSSTLRPDNDTNAWDFRLDRGATTAAFLGYVRYVWAVRDGDVGLPNAPQISSATATPATLLDTQTSQLAVSAVDPDAGPSALSYQWTVVSGGGSISGGTSASATYTPADVTGSRAVVVRVAVSDGATTVTRDVTLQVNDANAPPPNVPPQITAATATPATIWEGQQSQLSVTAADTDGPQAMSYAWQIVGGGGTLSNAAIANPAYTAPVDVLGTQTVTLRVTVSDGAASVSRDVSVTVQDANPPPPGAVLVTQGFGAGVPTGWSYFDEGTISGPSNWRVVGGELAQQSNIRDGSTANDLAKLGTYLLYEPGLGWTSYKAKFKLRSTDDDTLGLMFRYIDEDNWYRFSWDAQLKQRRLVKKVGGAYTLLAADNVPYVVGRSYQVEVVAQNSQLEVWIDGVRVLQANDTSHNRGSVAFHTWQNNGAYFDDLLVEDLSGGNFNALPRIDALTATPAAILDNQSSQLAVTASDSDGPSALSYQWTVLSGGGSLSGANSASPVYTPSDMVGTQTVTLRVTVSDGAASVSRDLTVSVQDANPPPLGPSLLAQDFSAGVPTDWSYYDEGTISAPSAWRVVGGELAQQSNIRDGSTANDLAKLGTYLLYEGGDAWTNYRAKFKMRSSDDDTLGVMFRFIDANNYYRFSWDAQLKQRRLVKKVGGVYTLLAADSVPYVLGRNYRVELVVQGSQLEVWIDGARVFQVSDASLSTGTMGFYSWQNNGAYFDDVQVNATP